MKEKDIRQLFDAAEDEYSEFDRIDNPLHPRPDICAFLFIHNKCGGKRDMVCSAEHDQIWLDVDHKDYEWTQDEVTYLARCGVFFDEYGFSMFV